MHKPDLQDGIMHRGEMVQTGCSQPPRTRPRPGRRRSNRYHLPFSFCYTFNIAILTLLLCCCGISHAADAGSQVSRTQKVRARFASEEIIFDTRPAPQPALYRRAEASSIAAPTESKTNNAAAASSATSSDAASTSTVSAPTDSPSPLPKPFDGGLGTNYTQPSCPTFLKSMISNDTFTSCLPFSLLLQNSMSFFMTTKSFSSITATLDASCNIVFPTCSSLMSSFAITLRSSSACSQDYQRENPMVRQAYAGLIAYDVLYHASCLKNTSATGQGHSNFCFANAITNMSSPTDSYVYYLPLGITMPASSLPACNDCLKDTMSIFAAAASNKSQPLSLDYVDAAQMVIQDCGPNFVNGTIPNVGASGTGKTSAVSPQAYRPNAIILSMSLMIPTLWFLGW